MRVARKPCAGQERARPGSASLPAGGLGHAHECHVGIVGVYERFFEGDAQFDGASANLGPEVHLFGLDTGHARGLCVLAATEDTGIEEDGIGVVPVHVIEDTGYFL